MLNTLYLVLLLLAVTATLAWAVLAGALKVSPVASWRLAAVNLLLVLAVLMLRERAQGSWWSWLGPDLLSLAGFALGRDALGLLFKRRRPWRADLLVLALLSLGYLALPPDASSQRAYVLLYSAGGVWFFAALAWDVGRANAAAFGARAGWALALPFAAAAGFMGMRYLVALRHPGQLAQLPEPTLWAFVTLTLLLNVSLVACVLTRLLAVLRQRAEHDGLTGLMNRRAFETRLRYEQLRAQRQPPGFALIMIDLDHFKRINDEQGHAAGDEALAQTAARLRGQLREIDALARLGGEEFAVLLPATPLAGALQVAERLRATLAEEPMRLQGQPRAVTASFGVAHSERGEPDSLLQRADAALYRVKGSGRNAVAAAD
jgi:diguanylate cyclase (GGDEF)-like protein